MKIILAPAKKMNENRDDFEAQSIPVYLSKTQQLLDWLKSQDDNGLKKIWNANDEIIMLNKERMNTMQLDRMLSPAIFTYVGLAYQHLAADVLTQPALEYLQSHLRILSGFYGILKPFDGIRPYRLEMACKTDKNLYQFWSDDLYKEVDDDIIINLASKEYSDCITPYLKEHNRMITTEFVEMAKGKLVSKATWAKMARGSMVRYMAENQIEDVEEIKNFNLLNYHYRDDLSDYTHFVFERKTL